MGYYNMLWTDFKRSRSQAGLGNNGPADYGSFRFDSLHFLYYPIKLDWLNVIPRAGLRLTAYSSSSNAAITTNDIEAMIAANKPEGRYSGTIKAYDNNGGGKFRLIPEFGVQLNTKISRAWNGLKNAYFDFNGFRHIMEPYINYTYIVPPTVSPDNLYYFDDVDRIDTQNFVRVGLVNRFQTRRGGWNSSQVYTWASLENYMDIIFHNVEGKRGWRKFLGDVGTKLTLNATEDLSFTTELLIDASALTTRDILNPIDKASFGVNWQFAENWA